MNLLTTLNAIGLTPQEVVELRTIKAGTYFQRKPDGPMLVRAHYDRTTNKYCCHYFDDVNREVFLKGSTLIVTDAIF